MRSFQDVLSMGKDVVLCYGNDTLTVSGIAIIVGVRHLIRDAGCSLKLLNVNSETCMDMADNDWAKVYVYVEVSEAGGQVVYAYLDEQGHEVGHQPIAYEAFQGEEQKILAQVAHENFRGNQLELKELWLMLKSKPSEDKLFKALVVNKFLHLYKQYAGLCKALVEEASPSIYSLYLHALDFVHRHKLNTHQQVKIPSGPLTKKIKLKGNVVEVQQSLTSGTEHRGYGFKRFPEALFALNYWKDGSYQVLTNPAQDAAHVDLQHAYGVMMEHYQPIFQKKIISLSTIKWVLEEKQAPLLGLTFSEVLDLNPHTYYGVRGKTHDVLSEKEKYLVPCSELTKDQWKALDLVGLSLWDIMEMTTRKSATELSVPGIIFYGKHTRPTKGHQLFLTEKAVKVSTVMRRKLISLLNTQ